MGGVEHMKGYNKFKQFLLEQGIKQEEVATLLGMSRSQLNMILNGQRDNDFKVDHVIKLAEHYQISANLILWEKMDHLSNDSI